MSSATTKGFKDAAELADAVRKGEVSVLDAYVVEPAKRIVETVTEEEYRQIVDERRQEFVVGGDTHLGYDDEGKEIWEDSVATREHRAEFDRGKAKALAAKAAAAAAKKIAGAGAEVPAVPTSKLNQMFQAGSRVTGGTVAGGESAGASRDSHKQQELDNMLAEMVGEIDAGNADEAEGAVAAKPKASKRKADGAAAAGGKAKKATSKKAAAEAVKEEEAKIKREREEDDTDEKLLAKVKAEPRDDVDPVVKHDGKRAKTEVKDELAATPVKREIKAEQEGSPNAVRVAGEEGGAANMRAWLQGGASEGSPDEAAAAASSAGAGAGVGAGLQKQLLLEEDGGMWFFFVDAFEDDRANPPRLYLFGKARTAGQNGHAGQYESCCLVVEKMERCVHLLLNVEDPDDQAHVQEVARKAEVEFEQMCRQHCPGVKILRSKLKMRNYAFEKALKHGNGELPFLKVVLDSAGRMPLIGMFGETFTNMFGAQTSLLERFLMRQTVMGPSWLRLQPGTWREDPSRLSYCAVELRITPNSVAAAKTDDQRRQLTAMGMPTSSPPLRMLSIGMQTLQRSAQQPHEPLAFSCTLHPRLNADAPDSDKDLRDGMVIWSAVRRMDSRPLPRDSEKVLAAAGVETHSSEAALLTALLAKIHEFDPDVIAGHNAYGFDLDVLSARMHNLKLQGWQKMGRLRRPGARVPHVEGGKGNGFWAGSSLAAGRLVCDVMLQAKDLLPKVGSYDLANLAKEQLGIGDLKEIEPESLPTFYESAAALKRLSEHTFHTALAVARLAHSLQILPLTKQLTNLAGNVWNQSLQNRRAERNETLLCHEFHKRKFVLPDKESMMEKKKRQQGGNANTGMDDPEGQEPGAGGSGPRRSKAAYSGGLVLEPKVGLYDDFVVMLDFNSLYPSVIQEHNICFTTVERPNEVQLTLVTTEAELLAQTRPPDGTLDEGVLPQVLRRLVESRRNVKTAIKSERDPRRRQMLEIRQLAIKLTANSMYGCLGFQNGRFYAKPLAALITAKGREALQTTINVVQQELMLEVVYGDTDSVFVNTKTQDYHQAMQAAQQIKASVNKRYKRLEIEVDAVFGRLMLLKKKKYAALKVVDWANQKFERELKGLDIVRRDWCELAKGIGEKILMRILSGEGKEEAVNWLHSFLEECAKEMNENKVPLQKYVITKGLTKAPQDYPDAKNQPHVQVALRLMARGKAVRPGQEMEYIICEATGEEASKTSLADRARHVHEFTLDPTLKVDVAWYKKAQVHPLVSRLLVPVEGTDAARIAECLGLDGTRFAQAAAAQAAGNDDDAYARMAGADVNALFDRRARFKDFPSRLPGVLCTKCQAVSSWKHLLQPEGSEAAGVGAMFCCSKCPEQIKPRRAQNLFVMQLRGLLKEHCEGWVHCQGECIEKTRRLSVGQNMVGSRMVLRELEFMEHLCEAGEATTGTDTRGCQEAVAGMKRTTKWLLETNGFNWVDCGAIFSGIFGGKK